MLTYHLFIDSSTEMKEKLSKIDEIVETKYKGSRIFKDIEIMVIHILYYLSWKHSRLIAASWNKIRWGWIFIIQI